MWIKDVEHNYFNVNYTIVNYVLKYDYERSIKSLKFYLFYNKTS